MHVCVCVIGNSAPSDPHHLDGYLLAIVLALGSVHTGKPSPAH